MWKPNTLCRTSIFNYWCDSLGPGPAGYQWGQIYAGYLSLYSNSTPPPPPREKTAGSRPSKLSTSLKCHNYYVFSQLIFTTKHRKCHLHLLQTIVRLDPGFCVIVTDSIHATVDTINTTWQSSVRTCTCTVLDHLNSNSSWKCKADLAKI